VLWVWRAPARRALRGGGAGLRSGWTHEFERAFGVSGASSAHPAGYRQMLFGVPLTSAVGPSQLEFASQHLTSPLS
jgi:hypothetical protein